MAEKNLGPSPFLMSLPGISDATCLDIIHNKSFRNLKDLINTDEKTLLEKLPYNRKQRAKKLVEYCNREFNIDNVKVLENQQSKY